MRHAYPFVFLALLAATPVRAQVDPEALEAWGGTFLSDCAKASSPRIVVSAKPWRWNRSRAVSRIVSRVSVPFRVTGSDLNMFKSYDRRACLVHTRPRRAAAAPTRLFSWSCVSRGCTREAGDRPLSAAPSSAVAAAPHRAAARCADSCAVRGLDAPAC